MRRIDWLDIGESASSGWRDGRAGVVLEEGRGKSCEASKVGRAPLAWCASEGREEKGAGREYAAVGSEVQSKQARRGSLGRCTECGSGAPR